MAGYILRESELTVFKVNNLSTGYSGRPKSLWSILTSWIDPQLALGEQRRTLIADFALVNLNLFTQAGHLYTKPKPPEVRRRQPEAQNHGSPH